MGFSGYSPPTYNQSLGHAGTRSRAKAEDAYIAIRELLTEFSRVPGRQISDRDLSLRLKTSRTPVREALIRLAAEGHILSIPQKGYFSKPQHEKQLLDAYEIVEDLLEFALLHGRGRIDRNAPVFVAGNDLRATTRVAEVEQIFEVVAKRSGNHELRTIFDRFSTTTRPVRSEIATHETHGKAFQRSLFSLREAVSGDTEMLKPVLKKHLALERRLVPRFAREINARAPIIAPLAFGEE